jgi:hypothetical protein
MIPGRCWSLWCPLPNRSVEGKLAQEPCRLCDGTHTTKLFMEFLPGSLSARLSLQIKTGCRKTATACPLRQCERGEPGPSNGRNISAWPYDPSPSRPPRTSKAFSLRVIRYRGIGPPTQINVRCVANSDQIIRSSKLTRWANIGHREVLYRLVVRSNNVKRQMSVEQGIRAVPCLAYWT